MRESKQTRIVSEHDDKKSDKFSKDRKPKERQAAAGRSDKKDYKKTSEKREVKITSDKKVSAQVKAKPQTVKSSYEKNEKTNHKKDLSADTKKDRPSKNLTPDKRMDYYKERYGEDFTVKRETTAGPAKKKKKPIVQTSEKQTEKRSSLLSKIKSIFRKK